MANWILKAIVQKGISYLPYKEKINYWFQKNVTKGVALTDDYFQQKLQHAKDHLAYFSGHVALDVRNSHVLELGTGWYPIVPIAYFLHGVSQTSTLDLYDWLEAENVRKVCQKFIEWRENDRLQSFLGTIDEQRWILLTEVARNEGADLDSVCEKLLIARRIGDASNTGLPSHSIDFICSNNTFEHIPPTVLAAILQEFNRVLKEEGMMSHFIDMTDHFAHFDKSISIYNFLRFSPWQWTLIDNTIQPQNRMRFIDYINLYNSNSIYVKEQHTWPGEPDTIKQINLDRGFSQYNTNDLAISHGYLVSTGKRSV